MEFIFQSAASFLPGMKKSNVILNVAVRSTWSLGQLLGPQEISQATTTEIIEKFDEKKNCVQPYVLDQISKDTNI